jgi:ABC-type nitrate/sulfonate/bicarbonate transport system substrate-binding protein
MTGVLRPLPLLACAALILAACGSASVQPASAPASAAAPSKPAPGAAAGASAPAGGGTPIKIAIAGANIIESSADLAAKDGNYQRYAVNGSITRINGSTNTMAALQSGDIQFAMTTGEAVLLGQSKGLPLLSVAAVNNGFTNSLVMSTKYLQAHPLPSNASLQQRAALLNGATLGLLGAATDAVIIGRFQQIGNVPPTATKRVKMQNQEAQLAALRQGEVDGISLSAPESFEAEAEGVGRIVLNTREVPGWDQVPYIVALTTRDYAAAHPDAVKGTLAGIEEALAKMAGGGPAVLDYEQTVYPTYGRRVLQQSLEFVDLAPYKPMTAQMWQVETQILADSGQLSGAFSPKEGTDWTNDYQPPTPA